MPLSGLLCSDAKRIPELKAEFAVLKDKYNMCVTHETWGAIERQGIRFPFYQSYTTIELDD